MKATLTKYRSVYSTEVETQTFRLTLCEQKTDHLSHRTSEVCTIFLPKDNELGSLMQQIYFFVVAVPEANKIRVTSS